ncbi:30S ribosomal protein S3 [Candidatus Dependentiae bacterium]|nr:30S ribosomal protein S3 [Candidatus Dependentiae bacterium]
MGQKVNPIGFRVGITKNWSSKWFNEKNYTKTLHEDFEIRDIILRNYKTAGVPEIRIERRGDKTTIIIRSVRPAMIIGRKGQGVEKLKRTLEEHFKKKYFIDIQEVLKPELEAQAIAQNIALQLGKRVNYRRAMKKSISNAMNSGAKGIKIRCSGRLAGSEMARIEWYKEGRIPLHTIRADIDYGFAEAYTTYGRVGIKVWVYKGEVEVLGGYAE